MPNKPLSPLDLHRFFGVHVTHTPSGRHYTFRYDEPDALEVFLVGDPFSWENGKRMQKTEDGVFEITLSPSFSLEGALYKYKVVTAHGSFYRSDPYAFYEEVGGGKASRIAPETLDKSRPPFTDLYTDRSRPIHLLEASLFSFFTRDNRPPFENGAQLAYKELAEQAAIYLKSTGYTHLKLIARAEDSFFAPPAAHGSPEDFAEFVAYLHANGIGVIYSLPFPNAPEDNARLLSAADLFLSRYALDGIAFERIGNASEKEATRLLEATALLKTRYPDRLLLFEALTANRPAHVDLWRDEDFENHLSDYLASEFAERERKLPSVIAALLKPPNTLSSQSKYLTRSGENSLMQTFHGSYEQKFAENRLYHIMLATSGVASLSFMRESLAPFRPWQDHLQPEWYMSDFKLHRAHRRFVRAFNHLFLTSPAMNRQGAKTKLVHLDKPRLVFAVETTLESGQYLFIFNTSDTLYTDYALPVPSHSYTELFSSDEESYAGEGYVNRLSPIAVDGKLHLDLAPLSALLMQSNDCVKKA